MNEAHRDQMIRAKCQLPQPGGGECQPVRMFQYSTFFETKRLDTNVRTLVSSSVIRWSPSGLYCGSTNLTQISIAARLPSTIGLPWMPEISDWGLVTSYQYLWIAARPTNVCVGSPGTDW